MKIQIVVILLSSLMASSKSLLRDVEGDFEHLIGQLATIIETETRMGGSDIEGIREAIRYIAEVDTQHSISKVESVEQEVLEKIKDLGNESCYQTGKAELAELSRNAHEKVLRKFKTAMEDVDLAFMDGMAKLRQYQDTTSAFQNKFQECGDDVCKQDIVKEVMEQVGVIGERIEEYVRGVHNQIETIFANYEMEILVPVLDALLGRSDEILQKAKECVEGQKV